MKSCSAGVRGFSGCIEAHSSEMICVSASDRRPRPGRRGFYFLVMVALVVFVVSSQERIAFRVA